MNAQLQSYVNRARNWSPERWLTILLAAMAVLIVFQGVRYTGALFGARGLTASAKKAAAAPPKRDEAKPAEDFEPIVKKGVFGQGPPNPPALKLFGILGSDALLGPDPGNAKPVPVGGNAPTGEKVVEINADSVVIEKNGDRKTLMVFPDLKKK